VRQKKREGESQKRQGEEGERRELTSENEDVEEDGSAGTDEPRCVDEEVVGGGRLKDDRLQDQGGGRRGRVNSRQEHMI
jgi:hypothetical protein